MALGGHSQGFISLAKKSNEDHEKKKRKKPGAIKTIHFSCFHSFEFQYRIFTILLTSKRRIPSLGIFETWFVRSFESLGFRLKNSCVGCRPILQTKRQCTSVTKNLGLLGTLGPVGT